MAVVLMLQGKAESHPQAEQLERMIRTRVVQHFLALEVGDPELSVVFTDDEHIRELNHEWMGEDKPTDVLSFPMFDGEEFDEGHLLGDIVVNLEYAERLVATREHRDRVAEELGVDASTLEWGLSQEVDFLIIHGLLHLVGHDHADADEEAVMKAEERRLWEHAGSIDI